MTKMTIEEAAAKVGRSVGTLRRWAQEGRIGSVRKLGRVYFDADEIARVADQADVPEPAAAAGRRRR